MMTVQYMNEQYRRLSMLFVNRYSSMSVHELSRIHKRLGRLRRKMQYEYSTWLDQDI